MIKAFLPFFFSKFFFHAKINGEKREKNGKKMHLKRDLPRFFILIFFLKTALYAVFEKKKRVVHVFSCFSPFFWIEKKFCKKKGKNRKYFTRLTV